MGGSRGWKERALQAKACTRFQFKVHLFLQNVLQNLVLSTSKSITFGCFYFIFKEFSYSCLSLGDNFATCSGFNRNIFWSVAINHVLNFANVVSLTVQAHTSLDEIFQLLVQAITKKQLDKREVNPA